MVPHSQQEPATCPNYLKWTHLNHSVIQALLVFDPPVQLAPAPLGPTFFATSAHPHFGSGRALCTATIAMSSPVFYHSTPLPLLLYILSPHPSLAFSLSYLFLSHQFKLLIFFFSLHFLTRKRYRHSLRLLLSFDRFLVGEDVNHCVTDVLHFLFSGSELRIGCFSGFWRGIWVWVSILSWIFIRDLCFCALSFFDLLFFFFFFFRSELWRGWCSLGFWRCMVAFCLVFLRICVFIMLCGYGVLDFVFLL